MIEWILTGYEAVNTQLGQVQVNTHHVVQIMLNADAFNIVNIVATNMYVIIDAIIGDVCPRAAHHTYQ